MQTDRELLEMAAKAAGLVLVGSVDQMIVQPGHLAGGYVFRNDRGGDSCWNPLTDDGDALRLAIDLGIYFMIVTEEGKISARIRNGVRSYWSEKIGPDVYAATRRAIVRAAAAIGEAMP